MISEMSRSRVTIAMVNAYDSMNSGSKLSRDVDLKLRIAFRSETLI
jgi:hypothetical protein